MFSDKRGQWQLLLLGLNPAGWVVMIIGVLLSVLLIFGSLFFFVRSHLGQVLGIVLALIVTVRATRDGITEKNRWFYVVAFAAALLLFFAPADILQQVKSFNFVR